MTAPAEHPTPRAAFVVYPAIDVRAGRVVRLQQGDYGRETRYGDAPLVLALRMARAGAAWLHLVDLDAARAGGYTQAALLSAIKSRTTLKVQTGGGVRRREDVQALLEGGADRVVVGSLAVDQPGLVAGWIAHFGPERITVALDARAGSDGRWWLPTAGWTRDSGVELAPLLRRYAAAGVRHVLCTDIARDGMLSGPNLALYRDILAQAPGVQLQASGGMRDGADIAAARAAGCAGAVLGKSLLDGRLALEDALTAGNAEAGPC